LRFGTKIVLLLQDFFYAIPSVDTFILKVLTLDIFFLIFKSYFSNFKVLQKKKDEYCEHNPKSAHVSCIHPHTALLKK